MNVMFVHYKSHHYDRISKHIARYLNAEKVYVLLLDEVIVCNPDDSSNIQFIELNKIRPWKLKDFLQSLNLDIVVMYDDAFLANAAINHIFRSLRVPTLYVQHGTVFENSLKKIRTNMMVSIFKKVGKYSRFLNYYLFATKLKVLLNKDFYKKLWRIAFYYESICPKILLQDFRCDYAAVWGKYYKKITLSKGYSPQNIFIVGNPDLSLMQLGIVGNASSSKVLYIHQPLVEQGIVTKRQYLEFAKELNKFLQENNLKLLLKLHPSTRFKDFLSEIENKEIVGEKAEYSVKWAFTHSSSMVTYILSKDVPVFLVTFPEMNKIIENIPELRLIPRIAVAHLSWTIPEVVKSYNLTKIKRELQEIIDTDKDFISSIITLIRSIVDRRT